MPDPYFDGGDEYDPFDRPRADIEILGRGPDARKSKTFIKDIELATLLGFIRGHVRRLVESFRRLHSLKFTAQEQYEVDGDIRTRTVPEVLTDDEIRKKYPVVAEWERLHQEQVDHYASIGGFSVIRATGRGGDGEEGDDRVGSSAGSERRHSSKKGGGSEPRWQ